MTWLKQVHIACAILSGTGYFIRGLWMLRESPWLQKKWVRVLPHVIDTLLLGSAILLVVQLQQYPFVQGWLTAKVLALIGYIVVGAIGLKYGKTKKNPYRRLARRHGDIALHCFGRRHPSGTAFYCLAIL